MSKLQHRYIEASFELPGDDHPRFRAMIIVGGSPREALIEAKRNIIKEHPGATEIEEFCNYAITPEKAERITNQMQDNTWEGWFEKE